MTPCFRRPPTCEAIAATGPPSLLTSLLLSSATTHSLRSVSGLRCRRLGGHQSGGHVSWNQADLGALRTSDERHPCSKRYRLTPFCGREIQTDIAEGPGGMRRATSGDRAKEAAGCRARHAVPVGGPVRGRAQDWGLGPCVLADRQINFCDVP